MKEKILIDGKVLLFGAVIILWLFDFLIRTINVWLENDMLRKKFGYNRERGEKDFKLLNEQMKTACGVIKKQIKSFLVKTDKVKRKLAGKILIQE